MKHGTAPSCCLLVFLLLSFVALGCANTALDDSYCPQVYGNCTAAPIAGEEFSGPPYSGANANPYILEGVGYAPAGDTCNFHDSNGDAFAQMPQLFKDGWLLAASQDLYNGRHTGENTWGQECAVSRMEYSDADTGANVCGFACGQCFIVSGPEGSAVYIVNEIADIGHVGQNGRGLNLHIYTERLNRTRSWGGESKDIYMKPVPCPVSGGMHVYIWGNWGDNAIYFVILNHMNAIKTVHTRGGPGGNQTWVPLARDTTNRWHWETYGCEGCPPFQTGYGSIQRGSTNDDFELRITDIFDSSVTCTGLMANAAGDIQACVDSGANPQQFSCGGGITIEGCGYDTTVTNDAYYSGGGLNNCGVGNPACATRPAWTSGSEASEKLSWVASDPLHLFAN